MRAAKNQQGFTLIELVVTITFLGIAVGAVISTFALINRLSARARNLTGATQLAQQKIENYRNLSYSAIPAGTQDFSTELPGYLESPKAGSIQISEQEPGLKKLEVVVSYHEKGQPREARVATYVTERGINR